MTKPAKQLYAALIVQHHDSIPISWQGDFGASLYRGFLHSQARKNNCYALALRQIGG